MTDRESNILAIGVEIGEVLAHAKLHDVGVTFGIDPKNDQFTLFFDNYPDDSIVLDVSRSPIQVRARLLGRLRKVVERGER